MAEHLNGTAPHRERLSEWSPEREMLAMILDRLGHLITVSVNVAGGKGPNIPPYPRPVTAMERMRRRREQQKLRSFVDRVNARQRSS